MTCWTFAHGPVCGALLALVFLSCGGKTSLGEVDAGEPRKVPQASEELCNRLDDDLDGQVDEMFRDEAGRYVHAEHCGACGARCHPDDGASCQIIGTRARCVETCESGDALAHDGRCVPAFDHLCLACESDADCGLAADARCIELGGERVCSTGCEAGVPAGYRCVEGYLAPLGGSCACTADASFTLACALEDPTGLRCPGIATCDAGTLSACEAPEDTCDEIDNDCDGTVDEDFVDERGAYFVDPRHCGRCGVDCREDGLNDLTCGGDPFAPRCVLDCPDVRDGLDPNDSVDADGEIANGCECRWSSPEDEAGPLQTEGDVLDTNCDGADGVVIESFYVSPDGDDTAPGSPTRPFRTVARGFEAAQASLSQPSPRPHVFVASGTYVEAPTLPPGIFVHGGYRRDFRALDPSGFRTEIRASVDSPSPGRAALVIDETGATGTRTLVEGLVLVGADAQAAGEPAFGLVSRGEGSGVVTLRNVQVRAGVGGDGQPGAAGGAGDSPTSGGVKGQDPRAAAEDGSRRCQTANAQNTVMGGAGAAHSCGGNATRGGSGGQSRCPTLRGTQANGSTGSGGAQGGFGGDDLFGPIVGRGYGCPADICCGLSDFEVPTDFQGPGDGRHGNPGRAGTDGQGCRDALGQLRDMRWVGGTATAGTSGGHGAGGGGGGAGGGVVMDYYEDFCEFADGLGGGGGGGGAGGCGGGSGREGTSGGPSIAVAMFGNPIEVEDSVLLPSAGGRGGDGGPGGAGGAGSEGGEGGYVAREAQTTPTLAGAYRGGRGGNGGDGGDGGGGGGGCGGASLGIWVVTGGDVQSLVRRLELQNSFAASRAGEGGRGGGTERSHGANGVSAAVHGEAP